MMVFCTSRCKTQRMCDEAIHSCLAALRFIPDWFVTSRMLKKFDNALHANDDTLSFNDDFNKVTFIANQRHILAIDFEKINLDENNNFVKDDPDTIIHVRFLASRSKFEKRETLKKDK